MKIMQHHLQGRRMIAWYSLVIVAYSSVRLGRLPMVLGTGPLNWLWSSRLKQVHSAKKKELMKLFRWECETDEKLFQLYT